MFNDYKTASQVGSNRLRVPSGTQNEAYFFLPFKIFILKKSNIPMTKFSHSGVIYFWALSINCENSSLNAPLALRNLLWTFFSKTLFVQEVRRLLYRIVHNFFWKKELKSFDTDFYLQKLCNKKPHNLCVSIVDYSAGELFPHVIQPLWHF